MGLLAAAPLLLAAGKAHAFKTLSDVDVPAGAYVQPAGGLWETLQHVTDGTNPSTAIATELPRVTPAIRALDNTTVEIAGYLLPLGTGFGRADYVLSQYPFHCGFCYSGGRGTLMLVRAAKPLPETSRMVTLAGRFRLQETVPDDYYFQLLDAAVV